MNGAARETQQRWVGRGELHQMDVLVWEVMRLREEVNALKRETRASGVGDAQPPDGYR